MSQLLTEKLKDNKVLPIIRSDNPNDVINKVKALVAGGLDIVEVNVQTPEIFEAIKEVSGDAIICAGGLITSIQVQAALDSGAKILSSPIFQTHLVKISKDRHVPLIAGTSTANEAYSAWKARIPIVKIYPISAMGGVDYITNLLRPMPFLNVIPQGAVELSQIKGYIEAGALAVGVGRNLTNASSYAEITERTRLLLEQLN